MPGRKPSTIEQVMHSYGLQRVAQLAKEGMQVGGKRMMEGLGTLFPRANQTVFKELINRYRQAKAAAKLSGPRQAAQQQAAAPISPKQKGEWQYTVKTKVAFGRKGEILSWDLPIISSKQLTEDQLRGRLVESIAIFKNKAQGDSERKFGERLEMTEFDVMFVTRKR